MNSGKNNPTSIFSFIRFLFSQWRSAMAMLTLVLWLFISMAFILLQPDANDPVDPDADSPIVKYWREYGWQLHDSAALHGVHFIDEQNGWAVGDSGTILVTRDSGNNWNTQTGSFPQDLNAVHFVNHKLGWAAGNNGTILTTRDGGNTWAVIGSITTETLNSVYFINERDGWLAGNNGTILVTRDSGNTWNTQTGSPMRDLNAVYFVSHKLGWVAGDDGIILTTRDGGITWKTVDNAAGNLNSVHFIDERNGWAAGDNGTILITRDGGNTWNTPDGNFTPDFNAVHFVNHELGWVVGDEGTILFTQDGGKNWRKQASGTMRRLESVHFVNDQYGWAIGTDETILVTQNGGGHWNAARFVHASLPAWYWIISVLCAIIFLLGLLGIRVPPGSDAITAMLSSDRPLRGNESDALESKKLAWALSRFLRHQRTEPPLTIAINAPWGGGKSSLMNWLREDMERFGFRPAWFNAWHYEKQEQMFPALLETIRQQAIPSLLSRSGIKFRYRLLWHRCKKHPVLAIFLLILICFPAGYLSAHHTIVWESAQARMEAGLTQIFPRHNPLPSATSSVIAPDYDVSAQSQPEKPRRKPVKEEVNRSDKLAADGAHSNEKDYMSGNSGAHEPQAVSNKELDLMVMLLALFPGLAPVIGLWKGLQSFNTSGNWLERWLNPTEQSKATQETAYRAQFARDFQAVTSALDHTLIIFIDDLDRCQPASVCEVMEVLNFLASEGSCHIVIGVWRDGVERAIGLGFAAAAREFHQISKLQAKEVDQTEKNDCHDQEDSDAIDEAEIRRRYGQLYLEKLVNIWVSVSELKIAAAQNMLRNGQYAPASIDKEIMNLIKKIAEFIPAHPSVLSDRLRDNWQKLHVRIRGLKIHQPDFRKLWRKAYLFKLLSQSWQFPLRITGYFLLGATCWSFLLAIGSAIPEFQWIKDTYDYLISKTPENIIGGTLWIMGIVLFPVPALKPAWHGLQFTVLSRLPAKPPARAWIFIPPMVIALIMIGIYAFQSGVDWSQTTEKNPAGLSGSINEASGHATETGESAYSDTTAGAVQDTLMAASEEPETIKVLTEELRWPIGIALLFSIPIWIEWLRFRSEWPGDSLAFDEALQFWSPVLAKRFDTPRRLKRFLNHLRFNAMRLRTLQKPDPTHWEHFWNRYIRGEKPDLAHEDEMCGKESGLLLLSVLEACCGSDFEMKSMLVITAGAGNSGKTGKTFHPDWKERLKIDTQLVKERGEAWGDALRKLLIERLSYYEHNAMPQPDLKDLRQFEELAPARITPASVRLAGIPEQVSIAWDRKIEQRIHTRRRLASIDIRQSATDRRSGSDRRGQQEAA